MSNFDALTLVGFGVNAAAMLINLATGAYSLAGLQALILPIVVIGRLYLSNVLATSGANLRQAVADAAIAEMAQAEMKRQIDAGNLQAVLAPPPTRERGSTH